MRGEKNDCEQYDLGLRRIRRFVWKFYAPSLDLEVTELFGRAANLLVYIEGHNPIHVDIDI